jgi:lipoyl(octanoyl) transferase
MSDLARHLTIRSLGLVDYLSTWQAMQHFTQTRDEHTCDEIWCLQHFPIYTQGQAGKEEHVHDIGNIPLVAADRGGQVTYHGPGQLLIYTLINLQRKQLGVREFVTQLEQALIDTLFHFGITAHRQAKAPGVYVEDAKIASIGLRVRKGCTFHGLSLNVDMDLAPFKGINPCGYAGLRVVDMKTLGSFTLIDAVQQALVDHLVSGLSYTTLTLSNVSVS